MEEEHKQDYSSLAIDNLIYVYTQMDRKNHPDIFIEIKKEIAKRFNIVNYEEINDDYVNYASTHLGQTENNISEMQNHTLVNLASPFKRYYADFIDKLIICTPLYIIQPGIFKDNDLNLVKDNWIASWIVFVLIIQMSYLLVNMYFLMRKSQTIGKMMVGIKITTLNGNNIKFKEIFLRQILPSIIICIPILGLIFLLLDLTFIFRFNNRCIHDLFAGTIVIDMGNPLIPEFKNKFR